LQKYIKAVKIKNKTSPNFSHGEGLKKYSVYKELYVIYICDVLKVEKYGGFKDDGRNWEFF
jgi:hypothetical protein